MKITCAYLILLLVVACMAVPVLADDVNTTTTITTVATTIAVTNETTTATTTTTAVPMTTATTEVMTTVTTAVPTATITTVPPTTATTVTTAVTATTAAMGNVFVTSSPPGAAILIDGTYYGTTPYNVNGLSPGNHLIRLSLSGYIDYEGTIYVIAGQETSEYGTLHPLNTGQVQTIVATPSVQQTTVPAEPTARPETTATTASESPLDSPTVIAALIGILTAAIGAGATIFTHNAKVKADSKQGKDGQEKKE